MDTKLIVSCEHASNNIPIQWKYLFESSEAQKALNTHLGIDIGAKKIAKYVANQLSCQSIIADYSRLLIELNRSLDHTRLFSKFSKVISDEQKHNLIISLYQPYRQKVEKLIKEYIQQNNRVIHLSIHSFTPVLNNKARTTDIGLLYDPNKKLEKDFCTAIKSIYLEANYEYKLKLNYPYRGNSDGFTKYLRSKFDDSKYLGIEIEFNQKHFENNDFDKNLVQNIINTIKSFFVHKVLTLG